MTHDEKIHELLTIIHKAPGLTAGQLLARCAFVTAKTFPTVIKDMHHRGLIVTTGFKETTAYHLTDSGRCSMECGELPAPQASRQDAEQEIDADPAGADEVVLDEQVYDPPLKVYDTDKTTLDEALAQLKELTAEIDRPTNLHDLIAFNRQGAALVRNAAPVAAALMESSANALERAYCQQ